MTTEQPREDLLWLDYLTALRTWMDEHYGAMQSNTFWQQVAERSQTARATRKLIGWQESLDGLSMPLLHTIPLDGGNLTENRLRRRRRAT